MTEDIQMHPIYIRWNNAKIIKKRHPFTLEEEFEEWMNSNLGPRGKDLMDYPAWYMNGGSHFAVTNKGQPNQEEVSYHILWIKDPDYHLMIKLTWGGL